jgi:hypothetical protein
MSVGGSNSSSGDIARSGSRATRAPYLRLVLTFICLASFLSPAHAMVAGYRVTLIYSGNLNGELEPCGCTVEGDLGGIKRRTTMVDKLREEVPGLILVSTGGLLASEAPEDRLTGEYILKGLQSLDYDAIGVQWRDLAFGTDFVATQQLPWVATNWLGHDFTKERAIHRGPVMAVFFDWLDPKASPVLNKPGAKTLVDKRVDKLRQRLKEAKAHGALTLVATYLSLDEATQQLPMVDIDVLFIKSAYEKFGAPQKVGSTLVLQPGSRGERLGRVDLTLNDRGGVASYQQEVIALPKTVPDSPRMQAWYDAYNAAVKKAYEHTAAIRKRQASGDSPYVGDEVCGTCHADQHKIWEKTKHSGAYGALLDVNKAFDPACIKCHTVGFDKPGGFIDSNVTAQLENVQCENCHGAGRKHAESKGIIPVENADWKPEQMCHQCHVPAHSPSFKFSEYWPRIKH